MAEGAYKTGIQAKLVAEAKTMLFLFVYLTLLLSAFTTYRRLILAKYEIAYFQYGYSAIEALVLAKVIVVGRYLRLGERFDRYPLIVPTLYKTLWFSLLVLALSVLEHLIIGWWYGKNSTLVFQEVLAQTIWAILANVLVLFIALVPLFAVWETGRLLGKGKLFELFFTRRTETNENKT